MAYTKIHPIKTTLDKAIDYITDSEKTNDMLLVSTFACSEQTAYLEFERTRKQNNFSGTNIAYHCIQSFKPGEVTAEQAHEIGRKTADEFLKGEYEYVLSTHIDRGHCHNHIIICGVNFQNGLSFGTEHDQFKNPAWKQLRKISDDICLENKLSVIALPEKGYGKCYYEWQQEQHDNSYKAKLKRAIDECILTAESFDDFLKKMQKKNYEYKFRGKTLSFRAEGQERFTRCIRKRLGWYYEPEQIEKRIDRQLKKRTAKITKENGFFRSNDENAVGLNRWTALKNMQEASKLLNMLSDYGVGSVEQLEEKISDRYDKRFDIVQALNDNENKIRSQRELLKMLHTYWDTKPLHDEYLRCEKKEKFRKEHSRELAIFSTSKEWLKEKFTGKTLPNRSVLEVKIAETESKREALLEEYHSIKKDLKSLETAHEKIETYLNISQEQERKKVNGELE